jgi:pimeloyl-ACP methyl ester carboxylesterase
VKEARDKGFQPWENASGRFIGWKRVTATNGARMRTLILHGNAGEAIDRAHYADQLNSAAQCDVYILEYPGYGPRPGAPTQPSLLQAADEAMAILEKDGPVNLIGESLGTGVAAWAAGTHPKSVPCVLLIAPFHNLTDVGQSHMRLFPVSLLLLDKYPAAEWLRDYRGRVAVLLAGEDEIIPKRFGQRLYDVYAGPKKVWETPGATHNELPDQPPDWWRELAKFWNDRG